MAASDKIMFEIYRESEYSGEYRVVYFTELNERNKESEINRAMAGEHYLDGFITESRKEDAKIAITGLLSRLNTGAGITAQEARLMLDPFMKE